MREGQNSYRPKSLTDDNGEREPTPGIAQLSKTPLWAELLLFRGILPKGLSFEYNLINRDLNKRAISRFD